MRRLRPSARALADRREEAFGDAGREGSAALTLDQLHLAPGDLVQLQGLQEGAREWHNVRFLGLLKGKSLMVSTPMLEDKVMFVREGQWFRVRAFAGLHACGFEAQVLASYMRPYPYLHLSYPREVQALQVRRALRAPVDIIVAVYEREGSPLMASGRVVDLSVGGARIVAPRPLGNQGEERYITFKARLEDIEELIGIPVVIRSVERSEDGRDGAYAHGVQFGELPQNQRLLLMSLVYQRLLKEA